MIDEELRARIRRLYFGEHWKVGTIAAQLGVHHETVRRAIEVDRFVSRGRHVPSVLDPYLDFIGKVLAEYPRLRATRVHEMLVERGYRGSVVQTRRVVRRLRPIPKAEAYLRLSTLPGEQGQVDWGHFGHLEIGRAKRPLMAFVMVLSWSRALHVVFTLDATMESFLRGHVLSFEAFGGVPRVLLYDNLKSAVLSRRGDLVQFHPRLLELSGHYHFEPRPVAPARGNEKGRVERQIRFLRDRFFAARTFRGVEDLNRQFLKWRDEWAHARPCPGDEEMSVAEAHEKEQEVLMGMPEHPFEYALVKGVKSGKTPYVRFDLNDYSIPHERVRQPLTLVADEAVVRLLSGKEEVARHRRSWGRREQVENPAHVAELVKAKAAARRARGREHLSVQVPGAEALLGEAMQRGYDLPNVTRQLMQMCDDYGEAELSAAITEALSRGTSAPSAVALILEQARRRRGERPPVPIELPARPGVREARVVPHRLEDYDALSGLEEEE